MASVILIFDQQPNGALRVAVCANAAVHPKAPGTGAYLLPTEGQGVGCVADSGPLLYGPRTDAKGNVETAAQLQARVLAELKGFVAQYTAQQVDPIPGIVGTDVTKSA
jgi:hypothetical protein